MSVDTASRNQESFDSDYDSCSEQDDDYYDNDVDYYGSDDISDESDMVIDSYERDPEYFNIKLINAQEAGRFVREHVENVSRSCGVSTVDAKLCLQKEQWNISNTMNKLKRSNSQISNNNNSVCVTAGSKKRRLSCEYECPVCYLTVPGLSATTLPSCGHTFCFECWNTHFQTQIHGGNVGKIMCMDESCECVVPEEFILESLTNYDDKKKYEELVLIDYIVSHPELRFCPGADCHVVVHADEPCARRVNCEHCKSTFCFTCGSNYHAPVDCDTMKKWSQKCEDDSETANYITANTKDCPKCKVCIEKNGGCNHMQCYKCQYDFCWVCREDWASHGSSYYECSKYKENTVEEDQSKTDARSALEKYIFYFQRWENHEKSLKLEEETRLKIQKRIEEKVMQSIGTWIDWQYLLDAVTLLHRCRYTLKYTYPYAYYLESGSRKECFEHLQAQLEAEVENLSWKVERAEITDRADLERQMDIAEKRRVVLLKDFLEQ